MACDTLPVAAGMTAAGTSVVVVVAAMSNFLILSFNSKIIRCANLLPTPLALVSVLLSPSETDSATCSGVNTDNMANATLNALKQLKTPEHVAELRGKTVEEILG